MLTVAGTCKPLAIRYTQVVPETTGNLDWRPECSVADDRRSAVFLRPYTLCLLQWSGLGEGALAHAGSHGRRYANLALCPATPIGVGGRVRQPVRGGRIMLRHIPARPEQTQSLSQFPLFVRAGRHAAELWLLSAPLSVGEFRDLRYRNLIAGTAWMPGDEERREAFNAAFARRIAEAILNAEVSHA